MKVIGNIDIHGKASGAFATYDSYPTDPKIGTWAIIQQNLMMCSQIGELPVWVPLSPMKDTKVMEQETASDTWLVDHELGSENVIVQVYDFNNNVIQPNSIRPVDANTTEVILPEAMTGKVVVMFGVENGNRTTNGVGGSSGDIYPTEEFDNATHTDFSIGTQVMAWGESGNGTRLGQVDNLYITVEAYRNIVYASDTYGGHNGGTYLKGKWQALGYVGVWSGVEVWMYRRIK